MSGNEKDEATTLDLVLLLSMPLAITLICVAIAYLGASGAAG
ncbi:MAG TPA: hypothetical protein VIL20_17080 [Sandaracinaceae bacterium]